MVAALMSALPTMALRKPKRFRIGRAVAFIDMAPAALANVSMPDRNADKPNTT
jgi:hypothetical protein